MNKTSEIDFFLRMKAYSHTYVDNIKLIKRISFLVFARLLLKGGFFPFFPNKNKEGDSKGC